ncbi:MAG: type II toxin-antitoxin system prevent-host-death family antitoxin [Candidatus Sulfotelmatobacter sp.]
MKSIGAFDAKTRLSELLRGASKGETIQITHRGVPVAKLSPPDDGGKQNNGGAAAAIRRLRKGATLGKITIRELIDEGRRW